MGLFHKLGHKSKGVGNRLGQKIKRGDLIGKSGNSGRAAGFHLHYEVHKNKKVEDPARYFFTGYIK